MRQDWRALVVFQQLLVLCDEEGYVDKTADAISARTTIPIEIIKHGIQKLSDPDPDSRSKEYDGRRIVLINPDRSWGWRIVNYVDYREIRNANELRLYWRGQKKEQRLCFKKPSVQEMSIYSAKIGLPQTEVGGFFDHYESNGWKVGKNAMKDWQAAMRNWKKRWVDGNYAQQRKKFNGPNADLFGNGNF